MSDVLFECPKCGKHLCVDENAVGRKLLCVSCKETVKVPTAEFSFDCPKCNATLLASRSVVASFFDCPVCDQKIPVPLKDPKLEVKPTTENQENAKQQVTGFVRREISSDGVIPMPVMSENSEYVKKQKELIVGRLVAFRERREKDKLKPLFTILKILLSALVVWLLYFLFTLFLPRFVIGIIGVVLTMIFVPLIIRFKLMVDD